MRDIPNTPRPSRHPRVAALRAARTVVTGGVVMGAVTYGLLATLGMSAIPAGPTSMGAPVDLNGDAIKTLNAAPDPGLDYDNDGLPDDQEIVLGLMPYSSDSDGDGYGDGEELARQTDPLDDLSIPMSEDISCSLTARGEGDKLRLVIGIHEPVGEIGLSKVRIGALTSTGAVSVPLSRFLGLADIFESAGTDGSRVTVIDLPLSAGLVHANRHVTFFLAAGNSTEVPYDAAAKVDVQSIDGVLMLLRPVAASVQSAQGGGSIRQPIPSSTAPSIPITWIPGAVCFQRAATVGGNGAVVLKEVVEADCLQGWDTFCASNCHSSVGTTYETIDPVALIGG